MVIVYVILIIALFVALIKIYEKYENHLIEIAYEKLASTRDCRACKKRQTMDCPNSIECYATVDKPHFELKRESKA